MNCCKRWEELEAADRRVTSEIDRYLQDHPKLARAREILDSIPGIGPRVAEVITAEIGVEMKAVFRERCALGELGRHLSRQQSHRRQAPVGPHPQRQHLLALGVGASGLGRQP